MLIHVYSRYVWVYPVNNKCPKSTKALYIKLLEEAGTRPDRVLTDTGGGYREEFTKHMRETGVKNVTINLRQRGRALGIIHAFYRTDSGALVRYVESMGSRDIR